ncbi:MAG: cysteine desulfurase [Planctomyces sp.]|nr:cysteine desulfurase [Planctomyces sp.]
MPRHYLDHAATSWPKPDAVYDAVDQYQRESGSSVGRAATRRAGELQRIVERCRRRLSDLLGAGSPSSIVFAFNGTDALNQAIHGLLAPGDHVVTSIAEHNSILRPLRMVQQRLAVSVDYVSVGPGGCVDPEAVRQAMRPRTRLVAMTHASNVTGAVQPAGEIGRIAREAGAVFLLDAAQTAGHVPIDVDDLQADLLAAPGHKGLLGPTGTGVLYVRPGVERELRPLRQGGTGSVSDQEDQPESMPERFESGSHNAAGIVGLDAAAGWLLERGVASVHQHVEELTHRLSAALRGVPGVTVFGPEVNQPGAGIVAFRIEGFEPQTAAALLDEEFGVECRAGLHCAPRMHRSLGTLEGGGLIRFSLGALSTVDDVEAGAAAVQALAGAPS